MRSFIDKYWDLIESLIYVATVSFVVGITVFVFMMSLPKIIDGMAQHSAVVVAASIGTGDGE